MLSFSKRGREETRVGTLGKSSLFVTSPSSHAELARFLACPAKGQSNVCHLHRSYDLCMRKFRLYYRLKAHSLIRYFFLPWPWIIVPSLDSLLHFCRHIVISHILFGTILIDKNTLRNNFESFKIQNSFTKSRSNSTRLAFRFVITLPTWPF